MFGSRAWSLGHFSAAIIAQLDCTTMPQRPQPHMRPLTSTTPQATDEAKKLRDEAAAAEARARKAEEVLEAERQAAEKARKELEQRGAADKEQAVTKASLEAAEVGPWHAMRVLGLLQAACFHALLLPPQIPWLWHTCRAPSPLLFSLPFHTTGPAHQAG